MTPQKQCTQSWVTLFTPWCWSDANWRHHSKLKATATHETRLPSNVRPTTRECVHLVTSGHCWSRDKDGSHNIRSAITKNTMLHGNFMALCFTEAELLLIEVLHCGNTDFGPFLHLRSWPWANDLHIFISEPWTRCSVTCHMWHLLTYLYMKMTHLPWRNIGSTKMNVVRQGFWKMYVETDIQSKLCTTPLRGWSMKTLHLIWYKIATYLLPMFITVKHTFTWRLIQQTPFNQLHEHHSSVQ